MGNSPKKKSKAFSVKLGLALGSGGAKGFAELGAIKAFEENNIEFDMVAGSSIGSIVGAFYADGYSSTDIYELLKRIDVSEIKNLLMMNMDTGGLRSVIDRTIGHLNIEELKKPFFAIATKMVTGEERVFSKGEVAKILCASSCFPPFFKPVIIEGDEYVDGAFSNSVPADVLKNAGADFVVGIDLATHGAKQGLIERILPSYKGIIEKPWEKGYKFSDIMLHPDLSEYKATSFFSADYIYEIGYNCAMENMEKIKDRIEYLKNPILYQKLSQKEEKRKEKELKKQEKENKKQEKLKAKQQKKQMSEEEEKKE